jgi:hypoxanthine phosphoribosyltransferase
MPTTATTLWVLVVDDDRDAADSLGLLLEELGNQAHVTFGRTARFAEAPFLEGLRIEMRTRLAILFHENSRRDRSRHQ